MSQTEIYPHSNTGTQSEPTETNRRLGCRTLGYDLTSSWDIARIP